MNTLSSFGAVLVASACLMSCSVSSESYVTEISGYAVTRGRITRVDDMHTESIQPLTDGVALTVSEPGCRVTLLFDNSDTRVLEVDRGAIVVYGYDNDYVLKAEPGWTGNDSPAAPAFPAAPGNDRD